MSNVRGYDRIDYRPCIYDPEAAILTKPVGGLSQKLFYQLQNWTGFDDAIFSQLRSF